MKVRISISKKDGQQIEETLKKVVQDYYENPTAQLQRRLLSLNKLIVQAISQSQSKELNCQQIIAKLEILKIKTKSNQVMRASVLGTIEHLKSPKQMSIQPHTLMQCLEDEQLYQTACIIIQRLAKTRIKENIKKTDFNQVIKKVYSFGQKNVHYETLMVDTILQVMNAYGDLKRESGILEVCKHFLSKNLNMDGKLKGHIRKYLKILLTSVKIDITIIQQHQQLVSKILLNQHSTLLILQQIINICYNSEYCQKYINQLHPPLSQPLLTQTYIWSYSSMFCSELTDKNLQTLQQYLQQMHQNIQQQIQYKIYCIINNIVSVHEYDIRYAYRVPKNITERVMRSYLYLILYVRTHLSEGELKHINIENIEKICKEEGVDTAIIKRIIIMIKQSSISYHNSKSFAKRASSISTQSPNQSIMESLYPKASKIPKNDEDIKSIHQILVYQLKSDDNFQRDNLRSLKNRALESLRIALLQNQNIYFEKIFNFLDLKQYDAQTLKKLLQIANLQLKINPKSASVINVQHLAQIILQLDKLDHQLLDFEQLSEIFYICSGSQDWNKNKHQFKTQEEWKLYIIQKLQQLKTGIKLKKIVNVEQIVEIIDKISINDKEKEDDHEMEIQYNDHQGQGTHKKQVEEEHDMQIQNIVEKQGKLLKQKIGKDDKPDHKMKTQQNNKEEQTNVSKQAKTVQSQRVSVQTESLSVSQMIKKYNRESQTATKTTKTQTQPLKQTTKTQPSKIQEPTTQKSPNQPQPSKPPSQPQFPPQHSSSPPISRQPNKTISNTILKYKIKKMLKLWKKKAQKSKKRWMILREWHQTQSRYLQKLLILKNSFLLPLLQDQFISILEGEMILPNLEPMIRLSQEMKLKTSQLLEAWDPIRTELAPTLKPMINFLKIYKDYSQNYEKSKKKIQQLQQYPKFKTLVKVNIQTLLGDYLFSPVQRFLKYKLLVKQYHKELPNHHKDKLPLQDQLSKLGKVNDQINQFMQLQNRTRIMLEIDKKFGNVVANARFFKAEFMAQCQEFKCKIYVFNDLIIVARVMPDKEELFMRIKLTGKSCVMRKPDCKSFKNRIYICGIDTSIHLSFADKDAVDRAFKLISQILQNMYQNEYKRMDLIFQSQSRIRQGMSRMSKIQPQIQNYQNSKYQRLQLSAQVIGMQKIFYHGILRTYFIIRLNISKPFQLYQITFCELSILEDLQKHLKQVYQKLRIPPLDIKSKQTISNDLTKVSQHLCAVVEKFLNYVLRNKQISEKPERNLLKIGLHEGLWNLLNTDMLTQCQCQMCLHSEIFTSMQFYKKQIQLIQTKAYKFCILNSFNSQSTIRSMMTKQIYQNLNVDQRILWANCQLRRIDYRLQEDRKLGKSMHFKVHINILSENVVMEVKDATIYSNCREVIEEICRRLGIDCTLDLALCFSQDDQQLILDDDQILYSFVKMVKQAEFQQQKRVENANSGRFSIFDRLSWADNEDDKKFKKLSICLRKVICLNHQLEQKQCQANRQRYNLIIGQILRKFRNQTIILNNQDIEYLCATVYCIEYFGSLVVQKKAYVSDEKLKKYLPPSKWALITNDFKTKISRIIQNQMSVIDKIGFLHRAILKAFWKKYSFQAFIVQNTQQSTAFGNYKHLQIAVNYKKISISRKNLTAPLMQYSVQLMNYRYYADSMYLQTDQKTHYFKGNNLYMLDRLIQVYKTLHLFQFSGEKSS